MGGIPLVMEFGLSGLVTFENVLWAGEMSLKGMSHVGGNVTFL